MWANKKSILFVCSVLTVSTGVFAQQTPNLTVDQAIDNALAKNLGLQISRLETNISEGDVMSAQADFDPEIYANTSYTIRETDTTTSETVGAESDSRTYQGGVRKLIRTGATIDVSTSTARSDSNALTNIGSNLDYESSVGVEIRQPLLKGAWSDYNLATLRKAKSGFSQAKLTVRRDILDVVSQTEKAYWDLAYAYQNVQLQRTGVEASRQLVSETESKFKANLASRVELLQAQSQLASDEEVLLLAESALEEASDALLLLTGGMDESYTGEVPAVSILPAVFATVPDFNETWIKALEASEDIAIQEETIYQVEQDGITAKHVRKPQLDVVATGSYIGLDDTAVDNAYENAFDRDGEQWSLMLEFSMPWGQREGKGKELQAKSYLEQEQIRLQKIKQELRSDVRSAWRNVNVGVKRVKNASVTLELQQQAFDEAQAKYKRGLISFREMLEVQRDYDNARQNYLEATKDLMEYNVTLSRLDGTLMARHGYDALN
jgi:outer membrane protein TolC